MEKKVTVIIPNYNGLKFMEPCMAALKGQTSQEFDVLVVDNGSTDGSAEWLKEHQIPGIFLKENTGFSGAVNAGIRASRTPYVILLNNDTEAEPDYIEELVKAIEQSPRIFSVSPRMIQMHRRERMDDGGDMYSIMGWAYQRGVGQEIERYERPCHIFSACAGAAILMKCILHIWKTLMWDTGRKLRDTIIDIAPAPLCIMWEAEPAAPNIIPLRCGWRPAILYI